MNASRNRAVAALQRWRHFQEARAAIAHRVAQADVAQADTALSEARDVARLAQQRRATLLATPILDLDHCRVVGDIEASLWGKAAECELALAQAREVAQRAMQDHRDAHAMTDVARQRREHLDRALHDYEEKSTSDRLAELRNGATRNPR